jgi:pimeloyl-ACP methyl ester carboxylesterase
MQREEDMSEKKLVIKGVEWRYATGGRGEQTLLLFHGAVGGAETMRALASALADEYRTITPTIADVRTLDEVCDALSAVLDREHVARAHLFGGSFGGMVAQSFLKRRWRQAGDIVLLGASLPDPAARVRERRTMRSIRLLPFCLTRAMLRLEASRQLSAPIPPDLAARVGEYRRQLADYFDRRLTKETLLARISLGVDFNGGEIYRPDGTDGWRGRVLIIESGDDRATTPDARARLRAAYPNTLVCALAGAGQLTPLLRPEELAELIKAFLKEDYKSPSDLESCPADILRDEPTHADEHRD